MNIHENIKTHRTLHNLTQEALAEKLNVTPQAVSRWETGVSYPDIKVIMLTGTNILEVVEKAKTLGADGYVIKPFAEEELIARFV